MRVIPWVLVILAVPLVAACGASAANSPPAEDGATLSQSSPTADPGFLSTSVSIPVAETTFPHDGFRTQVKRKIQVLEDPEAGPEARLVVSLWNLSKPSGGVRSRATINFDRGFDNYVEVPTREGPLRLHLHRDGSLLPEPDEGGFT